MANWQHLLEQNWSTLGFGNVKVITGEGKYVFEVEAYLGSLEPNNVRVELYANALNSSDPERLEMKRSRQLTELNSYIYSIQVPTTRPAADYTVRVIPQQNGVAVPLEAGQILWQH